MNDSRITTITIAALIITSTFVFPSNLQPIYADTTFSSITNLSKNGLSSDPQMVVSGNNIYVVWTSGVREGTEIFLSRSTDGVTFSEPVNVSNTEGFSYKPRIAAAGNNLYVIWEDETPGRFNVFFARSTDEGKTFSNAINLSKDIIFSEATGSHDPQIVASGNNVYAMWIVSDYSWSAVFLVSSNDGGATLSSPKNVSRNSEGTAYWSDITVSEDSVYVSWVLTTAIFDQYGAVLNYMYHIMFTKSDDRGAKFEDAKRVGGDGTVAELSKIMVSGNNVYVIWVDDTTGSNKIMFSKSNDKGKTFSNPVNITKRPARLSDVAISDSKFFAVWQMIHDNYGVFVVRSSDGGLSFEDPKNLSSITRGVSPYESASNPSIDVSGSNVYVVWRDATPEGNYETFLSVSTDNGSSFSDAINVSDNSGDTTSDPQISVSRDNVYLVWTDTIPAASDVFFTTVSVRELTLDKTTDKVDALPEFPSLEGYNFEIWSHPWENSMYGLSVSLYGKICGEPMPPEGSQLMLEHHYTRPDGSEIIMMPESSGWLYIIEPRVWCNTIAVGGDYLNMTGTWNVYVVAKWLSEDLMQEVMSNTVNIVVNKPVFTSDKIEKISVEKIAEVSHANGSAPWFSLLDWGPNGDFILITYHDYSEQRDTLGGSLAIMSPDANEVKKVDLPVKFESIITARVSPSNDHILIGGSYYKDDNRRTDLFVYNIETGTIMQITNGSDYQYSGYADWTAGENIVYVDRVFDEITHESEGTTIWLVDPDGSKRALYTGPEQLGDMDVSPDGRKIVFVKPLYPFKPTSELTVFDIEKKEFKTVLESDGLASPRWSPNSELVIYNVYGTSKPGGSTLKIASVDGTLKEYLYGGVYNAPHNSLVSPDGSYILFDLDNYQLAKMELMKPIPEFPVNLIVITAIGLIGVLITLRLKNDKLFVVK